MGGYDEEESEGDGRLWRGVLGKWDRWMVVKGCAEMLRSGRRRNVEGGDEGV